MHVPLLRLNYTLLSLLLSLRTTVLITLLEALEILLAEVFVRRNVRLDMFSDCMCRIKRRGRISFGCGLPDRDELQMVVQSSTYRKVSRGELAHPSTPGAEVLQRIGDELHPFAQHRLHVDLLVLFCNCGQEEYQASARLEHVSRQQDQVAC